MTCGEILAFLESKAPAATAEPWDNPGLLVGDPTDAVTRVLVALDATPEALAAARAARADLIVTHHPVIFPSLTALPRSSVPYQAAAAGIGIISAHTNLDKAVGGVNDTLAALLGLTDVAVSPDGMGRIGRLPVPLTADDLAALVARSLHTAVRTNGGGTVETVAVCGGSGGSFIPDLIGHADAFVTGEVKHHDWLTADAAGLTVLEAGHYATEDPVTGTLARWLTGAFPDLPVSVHHNGAPYFIVQE